MTEPTPWYSERWFVWSGVFLALLLVVGAAMALTGGSDRASVADVAAPARHAGRLVDTGGSRCGLPVGNTDKPVGPPDAAWQLVGRVAVPSSPAAGPGVAQGRRRSCFAHSPVGALFAAASALAVVDAYGNDVPIMRDVLAETHARNVMLKQPSEPHDPFFRAQIAGFRVTVASPDLVIVDLALHTNQQGALVALSLPMRWEQRPGEGGDWRLMITDADQPYRGAQVDDLSEYVRWGQA